MFLGALGFYQVVGRPPPNAVGKGTASLWLVCFPYLWPQPRVSVLGPQLRAVKLFAETVCVSESLLEGG